MKKSLSSKLNNRIEIWGKSKVTGDLGDTYEDTLIKKLWADIVPTGGSQRNGDGDTEYSETNFKIRVRKTVLSEDNWIIYSGMRYDIKYILPNFDRNHYLDIYAELVIE